MRRVVIGRSREVRSFATKKQNKNKAVRGAFEKKRALKEEKVYNQPLPAEPVEVKAAPEEFSVWSLPVFRLAKPYFVTPQFRPRQGGMNHEYAVAVVVGIASAFYIVIGPPTIGNKKPEEQPIRYDGCETE
jgi:hypothetical protein